MTESLAAHSAASVSVWLIEDNRLFRQTIASLINTQAGLECTLAAASCEEALEALERGERPDIVLLDIGLPGISGIDGITRILGAAPDCLILMLTSHEDDAEVFQAICAGASGYLLKPSTSDEILQAIRDLVNGGAPINAYIARKVLQEFTRDAASSHTKYGLTPREQGILKLLCEGLTLKGIARELDVSPHTVDSHVRHIYDKLHVHSRTGAVALAMRKRLV